MSRTGADNNTELMYSSLEDKIELSSKKAIENALLIGYGFVLFKRTNSGYRDFTVRNLLWHEIDEVLRDMGVRPGRGDR